MKRIVVAAIVACALVSASRAQDDLRAAAERYIGLPAVQKMFDDMLGSGFVDPMLAAMGGNIPADKRPLVVAIVSEELAGARPAMEEAMIAAAAQVFTREELEAMADFYGSDVGVAILGKMQPFNQRYIEAIGPDLQRLQATIADRVRVEAAQ